MIITEISHEVMQRMKVTWVIRLALLIAFAKQSCFAVDLAQFQPCWRGQLGTTFQAWGFSLTPTNPPDEFGYYFGPQTDLPDAGVVNSYGSPRVTILPDPAGVGWIGTDTSYSSGLSGIWDLGYGGGNITLTIPDAVGSASLTREVWIQITEAIAADITLTNSVSIPGGTQIGSVQKVTVEDGINYVWQVSRWIFRVPANSSADTIIVTGGCAACNSQSGGENSFVESIVVDTRLADYSTIAPGGSLNIGTITDCASVNLDPGSVYNWELKDATGAAGVGFDRVSVTGTSNINVQATSGNKFTINLRSLNGASAGPAANFNNNNAGTWAIASTASGSLLNFVANKFALSYTTAQFQNDLGGGAFSVAQSGDGKSLNLLFTPNRAPIASDAPYTRGAGLTLKIKIADLLAASTSDPDGDARALTALDAVSAQGATITSDATYIYYEPINGNADSFNYTVQDMVAAYRAGDPVRTATAHINVSVVNAGGIVQTIDTSGGAVTIRCAGIPDYQYDLERSATVNVDSPSTLLTTNAPGNGRFIYTDNNPPTPTAFYRLKQH